MANETADEVLISEDSRKVENLMKEIRQIAEKNGWPLVGLCLIAEAPGSVVAVGQTYLVPEHHPVLCLNLQVGAGFFHATQMIRMGTEGSMPESLLAPVSAGPNG